MRSELVERIQLFVAVEVFHEHPKGRGVLRPVKYVAIDDVDQPTTTFVGLSERVECTPLSELDMLRPRHLSLASEALDRLHRLGFRHGDGHLGNFILGNDGTKIRIIDYEQAVRNASCARDGCTDQIFLTKADVEHLRNGTSLSCLLYTSPSPRD